MKEPTFQERCNVAAHCLPVAPYRTMLVGLHGEMLAKITALESQVDAQRKDAERYQWLRSRVPGSTYRVMGIIYSEGGEGVDAAIDAAIKGEQA